MSKKEIIASLYAKYDSHFLNKRQVAKELNVSVPTIDNMRRSGEIAGKKVSAQIMFSLSEVARIVGE